MLTGQELKCLKASGSNFDQIHIVYWTLQSYLKSQVIYCGTVMSMNVTHQNLPIALYFLIMSMTIHSFNNSLHFLYTLSHPENDRDVTKRTQGYTLKDASFMRQSRCSFLNVCENTQVARAVSSAFLRNTR